MNPAVIAAIISGVASGASGVSRGGPRRQFKWNQRSAMFQNRINRENQQWLMEQEREIQREQREYDSPQSQMKRYIAAGLNPHLIYGTGSSAGQAFPIHAASMPGVSMGPVDASYPDLAGSFMSAGQTYANTQLAMQRVSESQANEALKQIMTDIAKANPMLNPSVAQWVSTSMQETARLKSMEARHWLADDSPGFSKVGARVNAELDAALQRIGLNTSDLKIKNQILESKEFENTIKEVQAKWLKDGDVSPQHVWQAMMLILGKMIPGMR